MDDACIHNLPGMIIDDEHVYVFRGGKTAQPVYLGRKHHIEGLDPHQVMELLTYRMAFDRRHTRRVH